MADTIWEALNYSAPMTSGGHTIETIVLSLLLAFVLGQLLAWVYRWTHSGLSYSRSFVQSLVVLTVIVSLVMIIVDNNIVTAFGLIGALAIIRFRNVLKDTRDTSYVFTTLALGMGVGSQRYVASIIGALAVVLVMVYVHWTAFGSRGHFDGVLRCRLEESEGAKRAFVEVLKRHCLRFRQIARRQGAGDAAPDLTYQLRMRNTERSGELLSELRGLQGVQEPNLVLQEDMVEV